MKAIYWREQGYFDKQHSLVRVKSRIVQNEVYVVS